MITVTDKGETHLDRATLPGEDGRLAFVAKEIVFTIGKLCTEHLGMSFQNLRNWILSTRVFYRNRQ
jgi:hypothetical protein